MDLNSPKATLPQLAHTQLKPQLDISEMDDIDLGDGNNSDGLLD